MARKVEGIAFLNFAKNLDVGLMHAWMPQARLIRGSMLSAKIVMTSIIFLMF